MVQHDLISTGAKDKKQEKISDYVMLKWVA